MADERMMARRSYLTGAVAISGDSILAGGFVADLPAAGGWNFYYQNVSPAVHALQVRRPTPPILPGDYDGDRDVDGNDFLAWQRSLGAAVAVTVGADNRLNGKLAFRSCALLSWRR